MNNNISNQEPVRIGVYICHCGGNISDVVDVKTVADTIRQLPDVVIATTNVFMCSDPGQNTIIEDIKSKGLNRVVVAACSPALHELTFRRALKSAGLNSFLYEHANIREQVSWVTHDKLSASQKAIQLIAAAVAKVRLLKPLEMIQVPAEKHVLVVGAGIAGLNTAIKAANRGFAVTLIEKSSYLGGNVALLDKVYPTEDPAKEIIQELVDQVLLNKNIRLITNCEIKAGSGHLGKFNITLVQNTNTSINKTQAGTYIQWHGFSPNNNHIQNIGHNSGIEEIIVGAVIMATGFQHYVPPVGEYCYGQTANVITLPQFIQIMAENQEKNLKYQNRYIKRIAFIHCVGSRQHDGVQQPQPDGNVNSYCSRVCCTATLHAIHEVQNRFPDIETLDFHQDIRTYGRGHEDYYLETSRKGTVYFRWHGEEPPTIELSTDSQFPLTITVKDILTWNEKVTAEVDLIVLAVGMMPNKISDLVDMFKIPVGSDRFLLEVHPKLRPVEVSIDGILLAGTSQGPMDITESSAAAGAASVKSAVALNKGFVTLTPFIARVDPIKCTGIGECIKVCGYPGAIKMIDFEINGKVSKKAYVEPSYCKGCGMCASVCPNRAIDVSGWTLDQFEAMVDAIVTDLSPVGVIK